MASDKALYWIAVIVMALGLGNSFVNAHPDWAQNLSERPLMVADSITERATGVASIAEKLFGTSEDGVARTQARLASVQCRLAAVQTRMASRQARIERVQAERVRNIVREQVARVTVICPGQDSVPRVADLPELPDEDVN